MHGAAAADEEVFVPSENPLSQQQKKSKRENDNFVTRERKYARPDPSIKKIITEDTPIRSNPTGQYNLNFIDWDNEWEAILDREPDTYESPIVGMDSETFEAIFDEEMFDVLKEQ